MGLTPIHIRGRRKWPDIVTVPPEWTPKKKRRSLASVLASRRSSRRRPVLESLPAELLESILLYSENIAFPQCSLLIGAKLSGKATRLRLFMMAFHDTWDQWFGIPTTQLQGPTPKTKERAVCDGDASFQSVMLDLPWVDVDFILQAQQTWSDKYARHRWYQHSVPFEDGEDKLNHGHDGGFSHFNARDCFEADYERALKWPAFKTEAMSWGTQDVHPMTRMPADLIVGPWNEEKKRRLFWLTRGGLRIGGRKDSPIPWEDKIQCLENATISAEKPDPLIINCLIGNWIFMDLPEDVVNKKLMSLRRRLEWGGDEPESKEILRRTRAALDMFMQLPRYHHMPV